MVSAKRAVNLDERKFVVRWGLGGRGNLLCKASPDCLNVPAVFMRKEPTRIGSGSTLNAGCRGYTAVFKARLLKTGSTRYGTT
jgi:hypothetical protein